MMFYSSKCLESTRDLHLGLLCSSRSSMPVSGAVLRSHAGARRGTGSSGLSWYDLEDVEKGIRLGRVPQKIKLFPNTFFGETY